MTGENWTTDNRDRIVEAIRLGVEKGVMDIADRITYLAWHNADRMTQSGDLQRSISTITNQGDTYKLTITRMKKVGDEWQEVEVQEGPQVRVPKVKVTKTARGFSVEFGCYVPYAAAVEFGTSPHIIEPDEERTFIAGEPRNNPHLRFEMGGGKGGKDESFAKRVMHPGTSSQPFMRPAIEQVRLEAPAIMQRAIREQLQRMVPRFE